jgi:hypothetical protein
MAFVDLGFPRFNHRREGMHSSHLDRLFVEDEEDELDDNDLIALHEASFDRCSQWASESDEASSEESDRLDDKDVNVLSNSNLFDSFDYATASSHESEGLQREEECLETSLFPTKFRYHWKLNLPGASRDHFVDFPEDDEASGVSIASAAREKPKEEPDWAILSAKGEETQSNSFSSMFLPLRRPGDGVESTRADASPESIASTARAELEHHLYPTTAEYHWKPKEEVIDNSVGDEDSCSMGRMKRRFQSLLSLNPFRFLREALDWTKDGPERSNNSYRNALFDEDQDRERSGPALQEDAEVESMHSSESAVDVQ